MSETALSETALKYTFDLSCQYTYCRQDCEENPLQTHYYTYLENYRFITMNTHNAAVISVLSQVSAWLIPVYVANGVTMDSQRNHSDNKNSGLSKGSETTKETSCYKEPR